MNDWDAFFGSSDETEPALESTSADDSSELDLAIEEAQYAIEAYNNYVANMESSPSVMMTSTIDDSGNIVESVEYTTEGEKWDKVKAGLAKAKDWVVEKVQDLINKFIAFIGRIKTKITKKRVKDAATNLDSEQGAEEVADVIVKIANGDEVPSVQSDATTVALSLIGSAAMSGPEKLADLIKLAAKKSTAKFTKAIKAIINASGTAAPTSGSFTVTCATGFAKPGSKDVLSSFVLRKCVNPNVAIKDLANVAKDEITGDPVKMFVSVVSGETGKTLYVPYEASTQVKGHKYGITVKGLQSLKASLDAVTDEDKGTIEAVCAQIVTMLAKAKKCTVAFEAA